MICKSASFLGVIGFILHGMMGSRERCASLTLLQIHKISLNKLKRFIKITQSEKIFSFIQTNVLHFAGLLKSNPSGQLIRLFSSNQEEERKSFVAGAGHLHGQWPDQ
jgi:hypothetical protein